MMALEEEFIAPWTPPAGFAFVEKARSLEWNAPIRTKSKTRSFRFVAAFTDMSFRHSNTYPFRWYGLGLALLLHSGMSQ